MSSLFSRQRLGVHVNIDLLKSVTTTLPLLYCGLHYSLTNFYSTAHYGNSTRDRATRSCLAMPTYLHGLRIYVHVNKNWFIKEHLLTYAAIICSNWFTVNNYISYWFKRNWCRRTESNRLPVLFRHMYAPAIRQRHYRLAFYVLPLH